MNITFFGAAETVTGSCFRVTTDDGYNILIDCGLFQGPREIKERNYGEFAFNPKEIDVLLLTHAHIDHSGLIPRLCKKGFTGKIYTTDVTMDLCSIMLPDSGYIQEMEVERKNRKLARANKTLLEPIYTVLDAERCIGQFVGVSYDTEIEVLPGIKVKFRDAGHILGSAIIEVFVGGQKIVFSGDLGNVNQPIINDPTFIKNADIVVMESTYGNRFHVETEEKAVQLNRIIKKALRSGGNLVIPAFAVDRTQGLIYNIKKLVKNEELPPIDVYIDSPLAIKATEIFCKHPDFYDEEATEFKEELNECLFEFPGLKYTLTADESKAINSVKKSKIIISASGMCDAGRIKHHLKHNLWREESTILFVGYQAQGTLGRRLLDGEKIVRIHGEEIAVNANIEKLDGYSAHADQKALIEWLQKFSDTPQKIFLVHGEQGAMETLSQVIKEKINSDVIIPKHGQTFDLGDFDGTVKDEDISLEIDQAFDSFAKNLQRFIDDKKNRQIILEEINKLKEKLKN